MYFTRSEDAYRRLFEAGAGRQFLGEATTWYLYSDQAARRIHAHDPGSRIVAILRNPVDMMHSLYRWRYAGGAEDLPTFEQALAAEPERARGVGLPRGARLLPAYRYLDAAQFGAQIAVCDVFGEDQVLVLFLEDFRARGSDAMQ